MSVVKVGCDWLCVCVMSLPDSHYPNPPGPGTRDTEVEHIHAHQISRGAEHIGEGEEEKTNTMKSK